MTDQLTALLSKVEASSSPLKILSGLILCHCLVKIAPSNLIIGICGKILSTLVVSYDANESCPEFSIIKDAVLDPKYILLFIMYHFIFLSGFFWNLY